MPEQLTIATAVQRARALAALPGRTLLGLVGAPAAGKSTLADTLSAAVDGAVVVAMDGFHLPLAVLAEQGRLAEQGTPRTFDAAGFVALLRAVRTCAAVRAPAFDRSVGEPVPDAVGVAAHAPLVIVEGNYLLLDSSPWDAVRGLLDAVWFVEAEEQVRVERLIARHVRFGRSVEDATRRATSGSDGANARLVTATRDRADLFVRTGSA